MSEKKLLRNRTDGTHPCLNLVTQLVEHLLPLTDSLIRETGMVEVIEFLQYVDVFVPVKISERMPTLRLDRSCIQLQLF
jgi:hypothetical protein